MTARACIILLAFAAASTSLPVAVRAQKLRFDKEFAKLAKAIDRDYPFFKVKGIASSWKKTKRALQKRAKKCRKEAEFFEIVLDALRELRDGHASLPKVEIERPKTAKKSYWPGLVMMPATEGRVVVVAVPKALDGVCKPGMVVTKINGKAARAFLDARGEATWKRGGFFSSPQRARFFEYRTALSGTKRGEKYKIEWLDGKKKRSRSVRAELESRGWMHNYHMPKGLENSARSVWHSEIASAGKQGACGYIYLRRMDSSAEDGFAKAVAAHPDVRAWIVDLRGNTGGGYSKSFVARLPALAKGGRKVACIVDAGCVSAGETFARDLVRHAKARIYGQTSAGSSSTKKIVELCDGRLHVRFSIGTRSGLKKTIEFHGIPPHVEVEADPAELLAGKNTEIERALRDLR